MEVEEEEEQERKKKEGRQTKRGDKIRRRRGFGFMLVGVGEKARKWSRRGKAGLRTQQRRKQRQLDRSGDPFTASSSATASQKKAPLLYLNFFLFMPHLSGGEARYNTRNSTRSRLL